MTRAISYNTGTRATGSLKSNNFDLAVSSLDYGTANQKWYATPDLTGRYVIATDTYSQGLTTQANARPSFYASADKTSTSLLATINALPERSGQTAFTELKTAIAWMEGTGKYALLDDEIGNEVTDGLVLSLDASKLASFVDNEPTTNLQPNSVAVGHNSGGYGNVVTVTDATSEKGPGWKKVTISNRGNNFRIIQWTYLSMSANTTYCHSAVFDWGNMRGKGYYLHFDGSGTGIRTYYANNNYNTPYTSNPPINSSLLDGRLAGTIVHTAAHSHAFFISNPTTGVSGLNDYFYYKEFQSEATFPPTLYTTGSRSSQSTVWYDMSGNDKNGSLINGPGFSNGGITLDGSNDYVNFSTFFTSNYWSENGDWTISSLHRVNSTYTGASAIFANQRYRTETDNNGPGGFGLNMINGNYCMNLSHDDGAGTTTSYENHTTIPIVSGSTVSITYTFDGTNKVARAYKNGRLIASTTNAAYKWSPRSSGVQARAGTSTQGGWNGYWPGVIYDLNVYNKRLTDAEILQNYYQAPIVTDGLVMALDAGHLVSYENGSTTTYSLTGSLSGSLVNGVGYSGDNGGSWVFDGVDDYYVLNNNALQNYTTVTVSMWVYQNSVNTWETYFSYKAEEAGLTTGWGIRRQGTTNNYQYWGGDGNTGLKLYKNGILISTGSTSNVISSGTNITGSWNMLTLVATGISSWGPHDRLTMAVRSDGTSSGKTGMKTGMFTIHNRELSAQEIQQNYNAQKERFANPPAGLVEDGLIFYLDAAHADSYPGSGTTWTDLRGSKVATLTNGPTYTSDNGGGIVFDGSNDYADVNSNNIIAGTNPFTIESFYTLTGNTNGEILGNYGVGYTDGNVWFAGRYGLWINNSVYATNAPLPLGTYHMVATRDGSGNVKLYINGVLNRTGTLTASIPSNINFRIGSDVNGFNEQLTGKLYTVKVYSRVLSADEVLQNYNTDKGRFGL